MIYALLQFNFCDFYKGIPINVYFKYCHIFGSIKKTAMVSEVTVYCILNKNMILIFVIFIKECNILIIVVTFFGNDKNMAIISELTVYFVIRHVYLIYII